MDLNPWPIGYEPIALANWAIPPSKRHSIISQQEHFVNSFWNYFSLFSDFHSVFLQLSQHWSVCTGERKQGSGKANRMGKTVKKVSWEKGRRQPRCCWIPAEKYHGISEKIIDFWSEICYNETCGEEKRFVVLPFVFEGRAGHPKRSEMLICPVCIESAEFKSYFGVWRSW